MSLLAIAYPEVPDHDLRVIENFRKKYDKMSGVVKPHFTLVFPLNDFPVHDFPCEIKKQLEGIKPISFCLRSAIINKDAFSESWYTFLVPVEGYKEIIHLHDQLYYGILSGHLRTDIDFIPHITVGNSEDETSCKEMAEEWKAKDFSISGVISSVDVVKFENNSVETVERIKLL